MPWRMLGIQRKWYALVVLTLVSAICLYNSHLYERVDLQGDQKVGIYNERQLAHVLQVNDSEISNSLQNITVSRRAAIAHTSTYRTKWKKDLEKDIESLNIFNVSSIYYWPGEKHPQVAEMSLPNKTRFVGGNYTVNEFGHVGQP